MSAPTILPLDTDLATLQTAGGKGLNLSRLRRAGFPVPPGFIVSTAAYEAFVNGREPSADSLIEIISDALCAPVSEAPSSLEATSRAIRARFAVAQVPAEISDAIQSAYASLGCPPVAVRSSATAEDLPGFSFAGQQDTYLNVIGGDALHKAIVDCWSSLWTARAIGYRARNGIDHQAVSLAVVVQEMVPSEVAGVLFTANPLTGKRAEMVIDATFGLGEALVSGQVEPDHYVVDADGHIVSKSLGRKAIAVHEQKEGGTVAVEQDAADRQTLDDATILDLARLGRQVADLFGAPQDIEWARTDGRLYLLQSRPITTLYPVPDGMPPQPLRACFSFGAVQGMLDPMTPLGRDAILLVLVGAGKMFGYRHTAETQSVFWEAGERLWIDVTGLVRNRLGRRIALAALEYIEPAVQQTLEALIAQDRFGSPGPLRVRTALRLLKVLLPAAGRMIRTLFRPDAERDKVIRLLEGLLADLEASLAQTSSLSERLALIRRTADQAFGVVLPQFVPRFGLSMAAYRLLAHLASALPDKEIDAQVMMRGVPHNVTTEMDLALWQTAGAIRADAASLNCFRETAPAALASAFKSGRLPPIAQKAMTDFLRRYGMRGLGEIDLGRPRWHSDPTPIVQTLRSYIEIENPDLAPDVVYERGKQAAEREIERLVAALRHMRGGQVKAGLARAAARRMRALVGLRETPKFVIMRLFGLMQDALLADGARLVGDGALACPEDVFYLHMRELDALATGEQRNWVALVRERRQAVEREMRRRQIPRLLLSTGEAFYRGVAIVDAQEEHVLVGSPVSPGVAEGTVRVVLDPGGTQLAPGEILVCPGTDPSWTPLFLAAGGLVMEVGGLMTHGAVVAREYGIPAVVGVHEATQRLRTGQHVRVDGSSGQVVLVTHS
jgi:phosphohistidine swiveling domain-containing protein